MAECQKEVVGFRGAIYKKFESMSEAAHFVNSSTNSDDQLSVLNKQKRVISNKSIPHSASPPKITKLSLAFKSQQYDSVRDILPIPFMHDLHEPRKVLIYTDGSCKGKPHDRRAGIGVFWGDGHPWNLSARIKGKPTNNRAELEACTRALQKVNENLMTNIKIVTDSKFTIRCVTEWCFKWQKNGWTLKSGKPVKVRAAVERLIEQLKHPGLQVSWCHSPGHKGMWGNDEADKLANAGADLPYPGNDSLDSGEDSDIDESDI